MHQIHEEMGLYTTPTIELRTEDLLDAALVPVWEGGVSVMDVVRTLNRVPYISAEAWNEVDDFEKFLMGFCASERTYMEFMAREHFGRMSPDNWRWPITVRPSATARSGYEIMDGYHRLASKIYHRVPTITAAVADPNVIDRALKIRAKELAEGANVTGRIVSCFIWKKGST